MADERIKVRLLERSLQNLVTGTLEIEEDIIDG